MYDLGAAEELALRLGATRLQDRGGYRSYADPVGNPFCLYRDAAEDDPAGPTLPDRIGRVVVDCFSPRALAGFYGRLLDMHSREQDSPDRVLIARDDGSLPRLAFQHAQFPTPRWPDATYRQQLHLDIYVEDSRAAQELALRLGAIRCLTSVGAVRCTPIRPVTRSAYVRRASERRPANRFGETGTHARGHA